MEPRKPIDLTQSPPEDPEELNRYFREALKVVSQKLINEKRIDPEVAVEATQQAILSCIERRRKLGHWKFMRKPVPYIYRAAFNKFIDEIRSQQARRKLFDRLCNLAESHHDSADFSPEGTLFEELKCLVGNVFEFARYFNQKRPPFLSKYEYRDLVLRMQGLSFLQVTQKSYELTPENEKKKVAMVRRRVRKARGKLLRAVQNGWPNEDWLLMAAGSDLPDEPDDFEDRIDLDDSVDLDDPDDPTGDDSFL